MTLPGGGVNGVTDGAERTRAGPADDAPISQAFIHEYASGRPGPSRANSMVSVILAPLRIVLGAIFIYAGVIKLLPPPEGGYVAGPRDFAYAIKAFRLGLPDHLVQVATFAMPWTEIVCGVALVIGLWTRAAALATAAMLVFFIGLIASALARPGLDLASCGCFGDRGLPLSPCGGPPSACHLGEDAVMLAVAVALAVWRRHVLSVDSAIERRGLIR